MPQLYIQAYDENMRQLAYRHYLRYRNGLPRLLEDYARDPEEPSQAAEIFRRCGFVVIRGAIGEEQRRELHLACERETAELLALDPERRGNNFETWVPGGSVRNRWSWGIASKSRQLLHKAEWARLADVPSLRDVLDGILGIPGEDYVVSGAGGDLCGPGCKCDNYQSLHDDLAMTLPDEICRTQARQDRNSPMVSVAFVVDPLGISWESGPLRINAGRHWDDPADGSPRTPPKLSNELHESKLGTLCPLPPGSAVLRDTRCWHGGTPNISCSARYLPSVEYTRVRPSLGNTSAGPRFASGLCSTVARTMPHAIFEALGQRARVLCAMVVEETPFEHGYREDLGTGLGPLDSHRRDGTLCGMHPSESRPYSRWVRRRPRDAPLDVLAFQNAFSSRHLSAHPEQALVHQWSDPEGDWEDSWWVLELVQEPNHSSNLEASATANTRGITGAAVAGATAACCLRSHRLGEGKAPRYLAALGSTSRAVLCQDRDSQFAHWVFMPDPQGSSDVQIIRNVATRAFLTISDEGHVPGHRACPRPL